MSEAATHTTTENENACTPALHDKGGAREL